MSRNTCARPLAVLAVMLCLWVPAFSQESGFTVKGELQSGTPRLYSEYRAELVDLMHRPVSASVDVQAGGDFEFRRVTSGDYNLIITTLGGDIVHQQLVSVNASIGRLVVRMMETVNPPGAKTISVKQLLHPPTKKALQSFVQAQRLSESGDYTKAAEALERAVRESPEYAEAHVNLGAQYIRNGQYEAAMAELHRAIEIAGPNPVALTNLASAQVRSGNPADAVESARWALRLDHGFMAAHLILGALLAADERTRNEAILHLERVADEYESARRMLAQLR